VPDTIELQISFRKIIKLQILICFLENSLFSLANSLKGLTPIKFAQKYGDSLQVLQIGAFSFIQLHHFS